MKHYLKIYPLLFIFLLWACREKPNNDAEIRTFALSDTMYKTTTTAPVRLMNLVNENTFYGKITADNNKMIEVFPVVGGSVLSVEVELGDYVEKGQLLAKIRSTEVAGFEKELLEAQSNVLIASKNLKVSEELYAGKLNTERDVIEAKSELDKAKAQLHRIQETYNIYNLRPGSIYEVRAPISGFIIQKNINQDMLLRSDRSDNIFDIAQIKEVWAIANINEGDIEKVKIGMDAQVTTMSYDNKVFKGKVDKIFNIIDPETKAMKVRIILKNDSFLLKPEMLAKIRLSSVEKDSMICIPSSAIIFDNSKNYVMVFKSRNQVETRQIEVFRQVGDLAFIHSGLREGELVMTHNQLLIYDALND